MSDDHARIQIPDIPVIKHRSPFFRDGFLSMAIIGKSGCGKTRMLSSILPGISSSIRTVIIATAIRGVPLHEAIVKFFRARGVWAGIFYEPIQLSEFVQSLDHLGGVTLKDQGLLIFDDFHTGRSTGPYWDFIVHAFTKLRNVGWNFIIISQQPQFIPTIVRNCTTVRALFDCYSRHAIYAFTGDVEDRLPDRSAYNTLVDYIRTIPFTYILVREHPFEVSAGKLDTIRTVMSDRQVSIPTIEELKKEMGAASMKDLEQKSSMAQRTAGNTSSHLS